MTLQSIQKKNIRFTESKLMIRIFCKKKPMTGCLGVANLERVHYRVSGCTDALSDPVLLCIAWIRYSLIQMCHYKPLSHPCRRCRDEFIFITEWKIFHIFIAIDIKND